MTKTTLTLTTVLMFGISQLLAQSALSQSQQVFASAATYTPATVNDSTAIPVSIAYTDTVIQWMSIEEAMARQKLQPRKIFIEVYASWCGWCKKSESVFANAEIAHYINQNYYPVKFNCETKTPVVFKGRSYPFINEGNFHVNEFALFLLNYKQSYPGFVFLNEEANVVGMRNGFIDEIMLENLANYYGSNAYREMPFNEFEDTFVGKVK
ncbi:MAG: DUF255 domain-containing protein [Chitinophagales bacterium]